ncbi:ABC transporter permease [Winogradskyella undariae]|uniref:ABC transporter permease n=1 Tax=Winogradskyella undariae TaxID=1285465 RepID=UPI0015CC40BD|nr:ABC transporter permease [Winogradskyella undariae]
MSTIPEDYDLIIEPKTKLLDLNLKEVWRYRDLLTLFVRRDFVAVYKQTVLGPLWFILQPIITSIMQLLIFNNVAKIPVDGMPPMLFYLSGNLMWQYFSGSLTLTSNTFRSNAGIFGKVYFPRLITPLSLIISQLLKFGVQFCLFLVIWFYYYFNGSIDFVLQPNLHILTVPLLIIIMAGLALGAGMIISSLTTKYRDFTFLLTFAVQLMMYGTVVIYPLSFVDSQYQKFILANPMTPIIEAFRYAFTGTGTFSWGYLGYSTLVMLFLMTVGIIVFNRVEKSFMDTV